MMRFNSLLRTMENALWRMPLSTQEGETMNKNYVDASGRTMGRNMPVLSSPTRTRWRTYLVRSSTTSDEMPPLDDVASDDELPTLEELPTDDVIYSAFPGGPNPLHPWDKILIAQRAQRAFEAQRAQRVQRGSERLLPSLDIAPQAMNTGKAARLRFLNGPFFHTYVKKTQGVRYVHVFQRSAKGGNPNANATPEQQCTRCPYHERALVEREVGRLLWLSVKSGGDQRIGESANRRISESANQVNLPTSLQR